MSAARRCRGAFAALLLAQSALAAAGGLSINPVRVELAPGQKASAVTVTNNDDVPHVLQASAMNWTQSGNEPVLKPAADLTVSPVLFKVAPHRTQLVRLGFAGRAPSSAAETTYRLFLEEVPQGAGDGNAIRMLMRFGLPVFVNPATPKDELAWQLQAQPDGRLKLTLRNLGNRHLRVDAVRVAGPDGGVLAASTGLDYVLAGAQFDWLLASPPLPADGRVQLHAQSDRGAIDVALIASR